MAQWLVINKKADFKAIGERFQIDPVTARIIRNRDVIEEADIQKFLYGGLQDLYYRWCNGYLYFDDWIKTLWSKG